MYIDITFYIDFYSREKHVYVGKTAFTLVHCKCFTNVRFLYVHLMASVNSRWSLNCNKKQIRSLEGIQS